MITIAVIASRETAWQSMFSFLDCFASLTMTGAGWIASASPRNDEYDFATPLRHPEPQII
jgi:hypothetical protein